MFPDWLIRAIEAAQTVFDVPGVTLLGIELDTAVHFALTLLIVAFAVGRGCTRLGLGIAASLALVKEALDLTVLVHYRDLQPHFVLDVVMDLLAAAVAMGTGVVIARAISARRAAMDAGVPMDVGAAVEASDAVEADDPAQQE